MLKLSKKVEYALIAMVCMAEKQPRDLTTARELAEKFRIPHEMMGKVLQVLAKGEFIRSVQGIKGGYSLAKPLAEVKVADVVRALDGPIVLCGRRGGCNCKQADFCNIKGGMQSVQSKFTLFWSDISLEDLCSPDEE